MNKLVVLIDDNQAWTESTAEYLREEGLEVRSAHDGRQAIDLLDTVVPALIVLDVDLPIYDGFQVLRYARNKFATTPVIVISANDQADVEIKAISQGADLFLRKPLSTTLLVRKLKEHLEQA